MSDDDARRIAEIRARAEQNGFTHGELVLVVREDVPWLLARLDRTQEWLDRFQSEAATQQVRAIRAEQALAKIGHPFMPCQPGSCALPHPLPAPDEPGCHWPYGNVFFGGTKPYREGDPICMLTEAQHQRAALAGPAPCRCRDGASACGTCLAAGPAGEGRR